MMQYFHLLAGSALLTAALPADARAGEEIGYFLSRTDVAVMRTGTITACPSAAGELPTINYDWKVLSAGAADDANYVRVDVSGGFLAKRTTAFVLNPNGTLSAFNSSSEGQGGPVLNSLLKAAGAILLSAPGPAAGQPARADATAYCRPEIAATLDQLAAVKKVIRELENKIVQTSATSADLDLLDRRRQQRADLLKSLTLAQSVDFTGTPGTSWSKPVDPLAVNKHWFTADKPAGAHGFDLGKLEGTLGYTVKIAPLNAGMLTAGPDAATRLDVPARALFYRRPIEAGVSVADIGCTGTKCDEALDLEKPLLIGQWGKIQRLHVGHGGIFGSRQAAAKFDAFGAPLELSFGSDSGADAIASSIDAGTGLVTTLRDADLTALERQIKRLELEQKLEDLQALDSEQ